MKKAIIITTISILAVAVCVLSYFLFFDNGKILKTNTTTTVTNSEQSSDYDTLLGKYVDIQKKYVQVQADLEAKIAENTRLDNMVTYLQLELEEIENNTTLAESEKQAKITQLTNEKLVLLQEKETLNNRINTLLSSVETLEAELEILQAKYDAFSVNDSDINLYLGGKMVESINNDGKWVIFYVDPTNTSKYKYVLVNKGSAIGENVLPTNANYQGWRIVNGNNAGNQILFSEVSTFVPTSNLVLTGLPKTSVIHIDFGPYIPE